MPEAYIVDALRTPTGRKKGSLSGVHPADLGAHVLSALMERTGIDPAAVEDVVFGCVDTIGPQAGDIARTCWLAAGLPTPSPSRSRYQVCPGNSLPSASSQSVLSRTWPAGCSQAVVVAAGSP